MRELFEKHFTIIEDLRCECDITHKLIDVLILVMCAVTSGLDELDELDDIIEYGQEKKKMLSDNFKIELIPSKSTLTRILNMVTADKLASCIINIMKELLGTNGEVVAIDGKTIRSTAKKDSNREKLHIVTAYLTKNGVTLGQLTVNEKTNEIPTVRKLIDMIDINGKVITADAMHCQKETVLKIIENKGNYILGLKKNQKNLHDDIKFYMDDCISNATKNDLETAQTSEKNKNRYEVRTCYKSPSIDWLEVKDDWAGLSCAIAIHRKTVTGDTVSEETSYYITSLNLPCEKLLELVREHWKIESLHWLLDVVFSEDDCRILSSNGQKNMNILRKYALAMHKNYVSLSKAKISLKNNMLKCLLNDQRLLNVISVVQ